MKKIIACMMVAGGLVACTAAEERAVGGGLIGAGTGALVGGLATGRTGGALAGAAIGGAGGAIIGAATTPQRRYYDGDPYYSERRYYRQTRTCRTYDDFGNPIRVAC
jgi:predicted lipid-binding transport protein (Tim44 family)